MSHKKAKKIRQLYGRAVKEEAVKTVSQFASMLKPKPRWMPAFVFRWCCNVVLR